MSRRPQQSGFVLLMTLVLVLLAGVTLAGLARHSMTSALEAQDAVEALKRRWAITTSRATLLPRAERILLDAERHDRQSGRAGERTAERHEANLSPITPVARLDVSCNLAGIAYRLVITDEQAKLNVNELLRHRTRGEARHRLVQFLADAGNGSARHAPIQLQPLVDDADIPAQGDALPALGSYDQIFDSISPREALGDARTPGLVDAVTCWGSGRVNVRRASLAVIRQACTDALPHDFIDALLEIRRQDPSRPLATMLGEVEQLTEDERARAQACLTDRSTCHGLWMIAQGKQRHWHTLAVRVNRGVEGSQTYRYAW